jgi:Predicted membrane protein
MNRISSKSVVLFMGRYLGGLLSFIFLIGIMGIGLLADVEYEGADVDWFPTHIVILSIVVITLVWLGISFLASWLVYRSYKWELTDIGFKKESGVIFKRYVTIPYDKIQNVDMNRSLLHRILGLSAVSIQTAGYSGVSTYAGRKQAAEGYLPGLLPKEAEKLQDDLLRNKRPASKK